MLGDEHHRLGETDQCYRTAMQLPELRFHKPHQEEPDKDKKGNYDKNEDENGNGNGNGNGQGSRGNKNGPPGPEGNQKGPPRPLGPPGTAISTEASPPPSTPALPPEMDSSDLPPPKEIVTSTTSYSSTTTTSRTASPTSNSSLSTTSTYIALRPPEAASSLVVPPPENTSSTSTTTLPPPASAETTQATHRQTTIATIPGLSTLVPDKSQLAPSNSIDISASTLPVLRTTKSSIAVSPSRTVSEGLLQSQMTTEVPIIGTATSSTTTSSNTIQPAVGLATPNDTAKPEYTAAMLDRTGQMAGIAVGSIAGFAFLLTLTLFFYKWRKRTLSKTLSSSAQRLTEKWRVSIWTPRPQAPDAMENSLLTSEEPLSEKILWEYQVTFAKPLATQKLRQSFRKSLTRLVRMNPLALNPVRAGTAGSVSPRPKSFASAFFRRHSDASSHAGGSGYSMSPDQLEADPLPPLPPAYLERGQA
ncbi:hypothetical protein B0J13DRAFT_614085 [Dactylonectria estremocensis]|uniref:Mid2 domain-containing protein n=1 Tax=Dactylonectria estremocensis TaxID=1079267 RepID=A0A9P9D3C5_9HYPO|nr:hypothetical protein B0J13DRAFT_614085 [Dactylonectria estremocensis]